MTTRHVVAAIIAGVLLVPAAGLTQAPDASALRAQLGARYDLVALQQGIALVPRDPGADVRIIHIANGVVTVDGVALTGQELRARLGEDADAVLQVSYLDPAGQRALANASAPPAPGTADTPPPARTGPTEVTRGDVVRFGRSGVTIDSNERVQGDVVAFGGPVAVDGEVTGDVSAIGGSLTLGPNANVHGDGNVIGGVLRRDPGARVGGRIEEVGGEVRGFRREWRFGDLFGTFWSRVGSLGATVLRLTFLALLGIVAVALARTRVEAVAQHAAAAPLRAGLVGLLGQILFFPLLVLTVVVLAVSIVGIPLLLLIPFAILLVMLVMVVGFLGLAYQIGRRLTGRFGWSERGAFAAVALGVVAVGALTLVAKLAAVAGGPVLGIPLTALGYIVEYAAWTIGFGAAILAWHESQSLFRARRHAPPPPLSPTPATGES